MKFFTVDGYRRWYDEGIGWEDEFPTDFALYAQHLEAMQGVLSEEALELAKLDGIDDGLLVFVDHDRDWASLILTLRCGDLQMGYYDLVINYTAAEISMEHDLILAAVAHNSEDELLRYRSDVYRHELDILDSGRIAHRLMFHPGVWFEITCDSLSFERIPRDNRDLPNMERRYPNPPSVHC